MASKEELKQQLIVIKEDYDKKNEEYKQLKVGLDQKVKARDDFGIEMKKKQESIDAFMAELGVTSESAKKQMVDKKEKFKQAMMALQELSSKDLTELIFTEEPKIDVRHVMNGVLILLGKEIGWKQVQEAVKDKDFMVQVNNYDFTKTTDDQLEFARKEMELSEYLLRAGDKAFAAFGLWVNSIIGLVTVHKTVLPQVQLDQDKGNKQVAELLEMDKNMKKLTAELEADVNTYNALGQVCQGLTDKMR